MVVILFIILFLILIPTHFNFTLTYFAKCVKFVGLCALSKTQIIIVCVVGSGGIPGEGVVISRCQLGKDLWLGLVLISRFSLLVLLGNAKFQI